MSIHYDKKLRICKAASTLVEDGECVFLDGGTSIVPMIHFLSSRPIKIVTNNHLIVQNVQNPKAKIIVIGGEFNTKYRMSEGNEAQNMLRLYNFDRAFIGCAGVSLGMKKAFTAEMATRELKRIAMELSNHNYLLIDDSKLHVKGFCTFAQLDEFEDVFINRTTGMETLPSFHCCQIAAVLYHFHTTAKSSPIWMLHKQFIIRLILQEYIISLHIFISKKL